MNTHNEFLSLQLPDEYEKVLEREKTIRNQHIADIEDNSRKAFEDGVWSKHKPLRSLMASTLPFITDCARAVANNLKNTDGKATPHKNHILKFSKEDIDAYCYIALTVMLDESTKGRSLTHVYAAIASACEEEARINFWQKAAPRFFTAVVNRQKENTSDPLWIKLGLSVAMNRYANGVYGGKPHKEAQWEKWSTSYRYWMASTLAAIVLSKTSLFDVIRIPYSGNKNISETGYKLMPSAQLLQWVGNADAVLGLKGGFYLPLPIPPRHWTNTQNGGYWTVYGGQLPLVKNRNEAYQEEILNQPEQFATVFEAVNAAQDTAWRINQRVYTVLTELVHEGKAVAGLPSADKLPLPNCPKCGAKIVEGVKHECLQSPEVLDSWKGLARAVYRKNAKAIGQRLRLGMSMEIAALLLNDERFYYVYQTDFRGRLYPVGNLTPQGTDWEKGILEFADGVPLGAHGAKWLAVHVANCWGNDKVDYDERVQWAKDNTQWIRDCANEPLIHREWTEADSPFMFLAACIEWDGYCREGGGYLSHTPVGLDGSCSGIQHYSAMLRDEVGAIATNVKCLPNQHKKSDIYGLVAEEAVKQFREDATGADADKAKYAMFLLAHNLMDRKITKRAVMTLPYGSTFQTAREYVCEALSERTEIERYDTKEVKSLLMYAATTVWHAIPKVVKGAREGMKFLKTVANLVAKASTPVAWVAPSGFVVQQSYYLTDMKRIKTRLQGSIIVKNKMPCWVASGGAVLLKDSHDSPYINKAKQVSGIAPNFIHSLDASHLMFSVCAAKKSRITSFALVHDSLGVHAGKTEEFAQILREQFWQLYTKHKPLEDFVEHIKPLLISGDERKLPKIPMINTFCPDDILKAKFLFS